MDLQRFFAEETDADQDLPLRVGIGIDSGEAVEMGDGSRRTAGRCPSSPTARRYGRSTPINARRMAAPDSGHCTRFSWGGEGAWLHGPGQPGGREFCYFDGDDAVIVWMHERLGQETHRDILAVAREGGSDHAGLALWWKPWHHLIGKANQ
jgi:hypothetical protein